MENTQLSIEDQIKRMIITKLGLDILPEEIDDYTPLFDIDEAGKGLDLDSVDALELVIGIKETFGIKPHSNDLTIFRNVHSMANMVRDSIGE